MTTVFQNAHVFDGHRHLGPPTTVVVEADRIVAVGEVDPPSRRARGRRRPRTAAPRLRRRPRARGPGWARARPLRPERPGERARLPGQDRFVRGGAPGRGVDPRRRVGDGRVPGRHSRRRGAGPGGPGSSGLPPQPRPSRCMGQHRGDAARRHRSFHPGPRRRPPGARLDRGTDRDAPGRGDATGCHAPSAHDPERARRRAARRPALPALPRGDGVAGRDRRSVHRHGRQRTDVRRRRP